MRPVATAYQDLYNRLIKLNSHLLVGGGMELIDRDLNVLADLSNDLGDCTVKRAGYATLHGSTSFQLSQQLAWGSAIVRPYMLLSDGVAQARFNMGAYFTSTPEHVTGQYPTTYAVDGVDILDNLNQSVGDAYAVNMGVDYLVAVENIFLSQGYTRYTIDSARAGTLLPSAKGWAMGDNMTWLGIVNELLAAIGYRGVYSDWDGQLVCVPYDPPAARQIEWTYDDGQYTSQLGPQQTIKHDFYNVPNKWVGVRSNQIEGVTPIEGDGIFIYQNDSDGETSVEARGGVVRTKRLDLDIADQSALVTAVMQQVARDKMIDTTIDADTTPNPLHWHFDTLAVQTAELGTLKVQSTEWAMSLNGEQMSHNWSVI